MRGRPAPQDRVGGRRRGKGPAPAPVRTGVHPADRDLWASGETQPVGRGRAGPGQLGTPLREAAEMPWLLCAPVTPAGAPGRARSQR